MVLVSARAAATPALQLHRCKGLPSLPFTLKRACALGLPLPITGVLAAATPPLTDAVGAAATAAGTPTAGPAGVGRGGRVGAGGVDAAACTERAALRMSCCCVSSTCPRMPPWTRGLCRWVMSVPAAPFVTRVDLRPCLCVCWPDGAAAALGSHPMRLDAPHAAPDVTPSCPRPGARLHGMPPRGGLSLRALCRWPRSGTSLRQHLVPSLPLRPRQALHRLDSRGLALLIKDLGRAHLPHRATQVPARRGWTGICSSNRRRARACLNVAAPRPGLQPCGLRASAHAARLLAAPHPTTHHPPSHHCSCLTSSARWGRGTSWRRCWTSSPSRP